MEPIIVDMTPTIDTPPQVPVGTPAQARWLRERAIEAFTRGDLTLPRVPDDWRNSPLAGRRALAGRAFIAVCRHVGEPVFHQIMWNPEIDRALQTLGEPEGGAVIVHSDPLHWSPRWIVGIAPDGTRAIIVDFPQS